MKHFFSVKNLIFIIIKADGLQESVEKLTKKFKLSD